MTAYMPGDFDRTAPAQPGAGLLDLSGVLPMVGRIAASPLKLAKRARQIVYRLSHRSEHREYLAVLRAARLRGLVAGGALQRVKYLGAYLAEPLTADERRGALLVHYRHLLHSLRGPRARRWQAATLWLRTDETGRSHSVTLEPALLSPMEGESQLRFAMDGVTLATLTFAVVGGDVAGVAHPRVLFVGGVQGAANRREEMRAAAKANGEISATAMLILAARALSDVLHAGPIVGVSSAHHAAGDYAGEKIRLGYDRLWAEAGATPTPRGFHLLDPDRTDHADREPGGKHRARTRRKRQLKAELLADMRTRTAGLFGLPLPPPDAAERPAASA